MSDEAVDPVRQLAIEMAEGHRPVVRDDVFAAVPQFLVRCAACNHGTWQIWRAGDPPITCQYWRRAAKLGLVTP